jgi:hypothetical protein
MTIGPSAAVVRLRPARPTRTTEARQRPPAGRLDPDSDIPSIFAGDRRKKATSTPLKVTRPRLRPVEGPR